MGRKQGQISENQNLKGITMQVILPEEQVQEIQLLVSDVIKKEIQHFKEDIGLETPYLNKAQTCQYLGISNNTLDLWIKQGLPVIKIGKTVRFDKSAINFLVSKTLEKKYHSFSKMNTMVFFNSIIGEHHDSN